MSTYNLVPDSAAALAATAADQQAPIVARVKVCCKERTGKSELGGVDVWRHDLSEVLVLFGGMKRTDG